MIFHGGFLYFTPGGDIRPWTTPGDSV